MQINKLTPAKVAGFQPEAKQYTKADGMGLMLLVHPNGGRYWRYRYRYMGIAKMIGCGTYPAATLSAARKQRDDYRAMLASGVDPAAKRDELKQQGRGARFDEYAAKWIAKFQANSSEKTRRQAVGRITKWVNPKIGAYPVPAITRQMLLTVLRAIEDSGAIETAHRVRSLLASIFEGTVNDGIIAFNPVPPANALVRVKSNGFAAITDRGEYTRLLRAINWYGGNVVVKLALQFLSLTAVRPGELRGASWGEFDWPNQQWVIPAERMKMRREHVVPLSDAAVEVLRLLWQKTGGGNQPFPWTGETRIPNNPETRKRLGNFVFTINGRIPISDNTLNKALRSLGYDKTRHVGHGFRKSFSTLMHELGFNSDDIELCLAHMDKNKIRGIYNKALRLDARRELMDRWGEYFEKGFPE